MIAAKVANVGAPVLLKVLIEVITPKPDVKQVLVVVPIALLLACGVLRLSTTLFTALRELVFTKAAEGTARRISLEVFSHLHSLSLHFHLDRQTGSMTRDIDRGMQALISMTLYICFTVAATGWRTKFRRTMSEFTSVTQLVVVRGTHADLLASQERFAQM